jgi:hypothetical protein
LLETLREMGDILITLGSRPVGGGGLVLDFVGSRKGQSKTSLNRIKDIGKATGIEGRV